MKKYLSIIIVSLAVTIGPAVAASDVFAQATSGGVAPFHLVADTPDTAEKASVPLRPLFDFLDPFLTTIIMAILAAASPVAISKGLSLLHIKLTQAQKDEVEDWVKVHAGAAVAAAEDGFSKQVIRSDDMRVIRAANSVIDSVGSVQKVATALNITPDKVATAVESMVHGELGRLQQPTSPASP